MKPVRSHTVSALVLYLLLVPGLTALAGTRSGDFELHRSSVSGSGGQSAGGAFTTRTTTSQPDAGQPSGGQYQVTGSIAQGDPSKCTALDAASSLLASESFCAGVRLSWFDNNGTESGYRIRRGTLQLADTGPDVTSYDDTTAVPGVVYSYTVSAFNACGESNPSNVAAGHRPQHPVSPDSLVAVVAGFLPDSVVVNLGWRDNAADEVSQIVYRVDSAVTVVQTLPPNVEATSVTIARSGALPYCFAVAAVNCGLEARSDTACITSIVAVGGSTAAFVPKAFALGPIMPNPFRARLTISYDVPRRASTAICVYDVGGRRLRTLREGVIDPGRYKVDWDGRDDKLRSVSSGIYFVEMRSPGFRKIARMTLLR